VRWQPTSVGEIARRTASTAGGGGVGLLGGFTLAHDPAAAVAAALILAAAANVPKIIESIFKRRPAILKAKGEADVQRIKAASEAAALIARTEVQAELLRSGMDRSKTESALEMLRQQAINVDLPERRRLNDEALAKLLTPQKTKTTGTQPDSGPQNIVRPIRQ
jgi:hypothetical protein